MRIIRGKQIITLAPGELSGVIDRWSSVVADVGTGDGRAAVALARDRPDTLVVGLDAVAEPLVEVSRRAARKTQRGGVPNVLFAVAAAEQPPADLIGRADEVRVVLPWGSLLEGLALARAEVLDGVTALARPGGRLRLVVNGGPWASNAPRRLRGLPQLTPDYVRAELAGRYADHGIVVDGVRRLGVEEIDALHSTWAKRLRHGHRDPELTVVDAHVRDLASAAGVGGTRVAR